MNWAPVLIERVYQSLSLLLAEPLREEDLHRLPVPLSRHLKTVYVDVGRDGEVAFEKEFSYNYSYFLTRNLGQLLQLQLRIATI